MKKFKKVLSAIAVILAISVITPTVLPMSSVSATEDTTAITSQIPEATEPTEVIPTETTAIVETTSPSTNETTIVTTQNTTAEVTDTTEATMTSSSWTKPTEPTIIPSITSTPQVNIKPTTTPTPTPSAEPTQTVPLVDMDADFGNFTGIPSAYPMRQGRSWTPATPVTINQGSHMQFFSNIYGTPLQTNEYYISGSGEIAYCADQEATGPSGTSYNEGALSNPDYANGVAAIILAGYPFNTNGLSDQDARYATAVAIHWLENSVFGGTEGWDCSIRNQTSANGHDGALTFALQLFDIGVAQATPDCNVKLGNPTPWAKPTGGQYQRTSFALVETNTTSWTVTAPAGTKIVTADGLVNSLTGTGDATIYLDLVFPVAFANGDKILRAVPQTDKDASNVKVFVAGGNYQTMVSAKAVNVTKDPASKPLPAALGSFQLTKDYYLYSGSTRAEEGAVYQVWLKSESATYAGATTKWEVTTGANGKTPVIDGVQPGDYYVKQKTAGVDSTGLANLTVDTTRFTITVEAGTTTTQTYYNLKKLSLEIYKELTKADGSKVPEPGAVFEIWHSDYATYAQAVTAGYGWTKSTNAAGKINLDYLDKEGTYYAKQVGTSDPAISMIAGTTTIVTAHGSLATVNLENHEQAGYVDLEKTEDWTAGYFTTVAGIVFRLYRLPIGSTAIAFDSTAYDTAGAYQKAELTLDANGKATSGKLLLGTYMVTQVTTPDSHKKVADFKVEVTADGQTYTKQLVNAPITGYIAITKYQAEGDVGGTIATEAGAQFAIYPSNYATWADAKAALVEDSTQFYAFTEIITTDSTGYAKSAALPYGDYRVEQLAGADPNYKFVTSWTVTINQDGQTYSYLKNNLRVPFYLRVIKEDSFYKTPLAGASFELYQVADYQGDFAQPVLLSQNKQSTYTSNSSGLCDWNNLMLGIGKYYVVETSAPVGYGLDATKHYFDITGEPDQDTIVINDRFVHTLTMTNAKIQGVVSINKIAEGTALPLSDIEFDIFDADGTLVDHLVTDKDGNAKTKILPQGTYTVVETKAGIGYALDSTKHTISIDKTPEETKEYVLYDLTISNKKMASIEIYKKTADGKNATPMNGVVFGLYDSKTNQLLATMVTDESGFAQIYRLPGSYYVKELKTWDGYALSPDKIPVTAEWTGLYKFNITNQKTKVTIQKTDITDGKPVAGAKITIYDKSGKVVAKVVTDKDGKASIEGLKLGKYTFQESVHPEGYTLNTDTFEFAIDEYGKVTGQTKFSDEPTALVIKKTDGRTGNVLAGAEFTLSHSKGTQMRFNLKDGIWIANSSGEYDRITTDAKGIAQVRYLPQGVYNITEAKAPDGYSLSETVYQVEVTHQTGIKTPAELTIKNNSVLEVIKTGEISLELFLLGGYVLSILCISVTALLLINRRRSKSPRRKHFKM